VIPFKSAPRRLALTLATALLAWAALTPPPVAAVGPASLSSSPEYVIKAAYLLNFARLIDWPADAFATVEAPMTIGVLGSDPFGQALQQTVVGKRINRRRIEIKRLQWGQDLRGQQIVFISAEDSHRITELANRVGDQPILIVGESPDLARRGATINFRIEDDKVRFEVNVAAARRARLTISSQVLKSATIVRER
jgi:hypothetical protein